MTYDVSPQPFDSFLRSIASATYDELRQLPGSVVESASAFENMRAYLHDLYNGVEAVASFVETDGQVIDCIPADQDPAMRRSNGEAISTPPAAQPTPETLETTSPHVTPAYTREFTPAFPRPQHQGGTEARRQYPSGTIPMYRTTLEQLCRFRNLGAFSAKDGFDGAGGARTVSPWPKRYATGEQDVHCLGGASYVNTWRPFATPTYQATFSQQWYMAGHDGTLMQTVECGWHIDAARYNGSIDPHLFVYTTRHNYKDYESYFNRDGGVYRPAQNPYVLPGAPLPAISQTDGVQFAHKMGFYLNAGAWWFYFDDHPVGCYPLTWFRDGPLVSGARRAKFGGEVGSGLSFWPPMGSGRHASAGHAKAAYQRSAFVHSVAGGALFATLSEAGSTTGPCYTIDITNNSATDWGTYLYFGGPGGQPC